MGLCFILFIRRKEYRLFCQYYFSFNHYDVL